MKLDEMGIVGHKVKVSDNAPDHPGEVGTVVTMTTDRLYVQFDNGKKEWISNKYVVGTKKQPVKEYRDFVDFPLTEMAAKKECEKCGKTMAANHYWYKGGWKCKKSSGEQAGAKSDSGKKDDVKADKDPFPHMDDDEYNKLSKAGKAAQDAKEQEYYKRHGRTGPQEYTPKPGNEAAAYKRAEQLYDELAAKAKKK